MELPNACCNILDQLTGIIRQIDEKDYSLPSTALSNSTIGQHVRHTLEFFVCLQKGFEIGVVNYENRSHDKKIETDRMLALNLTERIVNFVRYQNTNCSLLLEVDYEGEAGANITIKTNYFRELIYNLEHAVHHMAIVKIGLREVAPYVTIPSDFGIASSTIRYRETLLAAQ